MRRSLENTKSNSHNTKILENVKNNYIINKNNIMRKNYIKK